MFIAASQTAVTERTPSPSIVVARRERPAEQRRSNRHETSTSALEADSGQCPRPWRDSRRLRGGIRRDHRRCAGHGGHWGGDNCDHQALDDPPLPVIEQFLIGFHLYINRLIPGSGGPA